MRITDIITERVEIEGNPGDILELDATFDIEGEEYPLESYSWGGSRGYGRSVSAEFLTAKWGGLTITRDMAIEICGKQYIDQMEERIADAYCDELEEAA